MRFSKHQIPTKAAAAGLCVVVEPGMRLLANSVNVADKRLSLHVVAGWAQ